MKYPSKYPDLLQISAAIVFVGFVGCFFLPVTSDGWKRDAGWQYAWAMAQSTFSLSPLRALGLAFFATASNVITPLVLVALCFTQVRQRLPRVTPWLLVLLFVNAGRFGWEIVVLKSETLLSGYYVWLLAQASTAFLAAWNRARRVGRLTEVDERPSHNFMPPSVLIRIYRRIINLRPHSFVETKTLLEITAYFFGSVFILLKIFGGEFNYAMKVNLAAEPFTQGNQNFAALTVGLKRPGSGRIEIKDIQIEVLSGWPLKRFKPDPKTRSDFSPIKERKLSDSGSLITDESCGPLALPPDDETQLGYVVPLPKDGPIVIDVTVLGKRNWMPWFMNMAQWRASCVVKPKSATDEPALAPKPK